MFFLSPETVKLPILPSVDIPVIPFKAVSRVLLGALGLDTFEPEWCPVRRMTSHAHIYTDRNGHRVCGCGDKL